MSGVPSTVQAGERAVSDARAALDARVREIVKWHFDPATGSPFWLEYAARLGWDPREDVKSFADLRRLGFFEDEWLRGGPVQRWIPVVWADHARRHVWRIIRAMWAGGARCPAGR